MASCMYDDVHARTSLDTLNWFPFEITNQKLDIHANDFVAPPPAKRAKTIPPPPPPPAPSASSSSSAASFPRMPTFNRSAPSPSPPPMSRPAPTPNSSMPHLQRPGVARGHPQPQRPGMPLLQRPSHPSSAPPHHRVGAPPPPPMAGARKNGPLPGAARLPTTATAAAAGRFPGAQRAGHMPPPAGPARHVAPAARHHPPAPGGFSAGGGRPPAPSQPLRQAPPKPMQKRGMFSYLVVTNYKCKRGSNVPSPRPYSYPSKFVLQRVFDFSFLIGEKSNPFFRIFHPMFMLFTDELYKKKNSFQVPLRFLIL